MQFATTALLTASLLLALSPRAFAQDLTPIDEVLPPPPIRSGEVLEPEVTIVQQRNRTVHEYRVGGQLRAVRVQPDDGPAYYLVDADGDGNLDTRTNNFAPDMWINSWVLFSWD